MKFCPSAWILRIENSRIENFDIQATCYFERCVEPKIWKIVPNCIKK